MDVGGKVKHITLWSVYSPCLFTPFAPPTLFGVSQELRRLDAARSHIAAGGSPLAAHLARGAVEKTRAREDEGVEKAAAKGDAAEAAKAEAARDAAVRKAEAEVETAEAKAAAAKEEARRGFEEKRKEAEAERVPAAMVALQGASEVLAKSARGVRGGATFAQAVAAYNPKAADSTVSGFIAGAKALSEIRT